MKLRKHIDNIKSTSSYRYNYIVSEIGINHNGCLKTALRLIEASADAGVDAVKFQKRSIKNLYTKKILNDHNSAEWTFEYLLPILKETELSESDYESIKNKCQELNLELIITPFDLESCKFCNKIGVDAYKISSSDMVNYELIKKCFSYNKPVLISTGMWTESEIEISINKFNKINGKNDFFILLANSTYPTPYESLNLEFISKIKNIHNLVGYSGHERGIFIPVAASTLGARVIEKHITFDTNQTGPDHKASMLPNEFKEMVENLRNVELSLGSNKNVNQAEKLAKEVFAKSAYVKKDMIKGQTINKNDVYFISPGKGIYMHEIEDYYGKKLNCNVKKDEFLSKNHFEKIVLIKDWDVPEYKKDWGVKCRFHDFEEYSRLKSPVIEFHCSQGDMDIPFDGRSNESQLIVHAPEIFDRKLVDICSDKKDIVDGSIKILQKAIDKTLTISKNFPKKKPKFVVHLGGMSIEHVTGREKIDLMMERAVDNFKKLNYNSDDIEILPENLPPRPWYLGGQSFQYGFMYAEDMIRFCNHFNLGMTYDVCHAALHCHHDKISLNEYTNKILPLVSHFHLSDAIGIDGEGVQIGEGEVDFKSFFTNLQKEGCQDKNFSWVTEIWSGHVNYGSGCRRSMHNLSNYKGIL